MQWSRHTTSYASGTAVPEARLWSGGKVASAARSYPASQEVRGPTGASMDVALGGRVPSVQSRPSARRMWPRTAVTKLGRRQLHARASWAFRLGSTARTPRRRAICIWIKHSSTWRKPVIRYAGIARHGRTTSLNAWNRQSMHAGLRSHSPKCGFASRSRELFHISSLFSAPNCNALRGVTCRARLQCASTEPVEVPMNPQPEIEQKPSTANSGAYVGARGADLRLSWFGGTILARSAQ